MNAARLNFRRLGPPRNIYYHTYARICSPNICLRAHMRARSNQRPSPRGKIDLISLPEREAPSYRKNTPQSSHFPSIHSHALVHIKLSLIRLHRPAVFWPTHSTDRHSNSMHMLQLPSPLPTQPTSSQSLNYIHNLANLLYPINRLNLVTTTNRHQIAIAIVYVSYL